MTERQQGKTEVSKKFELVAVRTLRQGDRIIYLTDENIRTIKSISLQGNGYMVILFRDSPEGLSIGKDAQVQKVIDL